MLYLDQPVQVGLSYDSLRNITVNLLTGDVTLLNETDPIPEQNNTFYVGTYPSRDGNSTTFGSIHSAYALWHFAQTWLQEFPQYSPNDFRISIATESYGGRYGPAFAAFFEEQNQRIENGNWSGVDGDGFILDLDTLLIVNGCIDRPSSYFSYPEIAVNNTCGIQASIHQQMLDALNVSMDARDHTECSLTMDQKPGGCLDLIADCQEISAIYDPENTGANESVNEACAEAEKYCYEYVRGPYLEVPGRNYYDITAFDPSPFPDPFYIGLLNQPHVQAAMGVPLNWTQSSGTVSTAFRSIGDYVRPGWIEDLAYLLDRGIKVTLAYGDRDYACNWIGGEATSLLINYTGSEGFRSAGYAPIHANETYEGGLVRQYGNLSFSRVFEAGHEIPSYQPETAYRIFTRALFNKDISTGEQDIYAADGTAYQSEGPPDKWAYKNEDQPDPLHFCYVLDPTTLCTDEQIESIENGTAVVRNYIVVDANSTQLFPEVVGNATSGEEVGSGNGTAAGGSGGNGSSSASASPPVQTGNDAALLRPSRLMLAPGLLLLLSLFW